MRFKILIVDDEQTIRETLSVVLTDEQYMTQTASDGIEAFHLLNNQHFDLLITDLKMPRMDGIELMKKVKKNSPSTSVIIITAYASLESAIEALRLGAFDYIIKPLDFNDVILRIKRLVEHKELEKENEYLREEVQSKFSFSNIIGESLPMKDVFRLIEKVAKTKGNVLITGKSGTGKELVARAVHYNSLRKNRRFVAINCGAIVDNLMESELFGHKKGSFTGAVKDKDGLFKVADEGTLFLDEVGDIPFHLQVKLLRAIETNEIIPVGSTSPLKIDVRLLAATNRDLMEEVEAGKFREDLFYRLNVVEIRLPALSERREDIPLLIHHFLEKYNKEMNRSIKNLDKETSNILINYEWKGGIRELENVIERAIILCESEIITKKDLPPNIVQITAPSEAPQKLKEVVALSEKIHIKKILRSSGSDKEKAAHILGISLSSLYRKMDELNLGEK